MSVARSEQMMEWEWEPNISRFIPDVMFKVAETPIYVEIERGNQNKAKLKKKVQNYLNYHRETREMFHVLFVVSDDLVDLITRIYEEMATPSMYLYVTSKNFIADVLNAELLSHKSSLTLSHLLPTDETE